MTGTTVENQEEANRRLPSLLMNPAVVRFLSCEPLLGPVDLKNIPHPLRDKKADFLKLDALSRLHWVIVGGESGPKFRLGDPDWFRLLRDQCYAAGVAFLFKQWEGKSQREIKALGRELDGVVWDQYPKARESA
jgi:protein gp37